MIEKMNQLAGRKYYFILHSVFLALIFAVSATISVSRGLNNIGTDEFREDYVENVGCEIDTFELVCDGDYYEIGNIIIDLTITETSVIPNITLLTKDRIISNGLDVSYENFLDKIGHTDPQFTIDDGIEYFESGIQTAIVFIVFGLSLVGVWIGQLMFNFLRALVNKLLINGILDLHINYDRVYRMTFIALTPLVIVNGVSRMIFGTTPVNVLASLIPGIGWIVSFMLNSFIVFGITYLMIKEKKEMILK